MIIMKDFYSAIYPMAQGALQHLVAGTWPDYIEQLTIFERNIFTDVLNIKIKATPQHWELYSLLIAISVWVL